MFHLIALPLVLAQAPPAQNMPAPAPRLNRKALYEQFKAKAMDLATLKRLAKESNGCRPEEEGENRGGTRDQVRMAGGTAFNRVAAPSVDQNPIPDEERAPRYFEPAQRASAAAFTAVNQAGIETKVGDSGGSVLVVFLFKPDCKFTPDILGEIIRLQAMQERIGFKMIPVSLGSEGWSGLARWRQQNKNALPQEFQIFRPKAEMGLGASVFGTLHATPTTFILDRRGRVAWRISGAVRGAISDRLNQILMEPDSEPAPPTPKPES